MMETNECGGVRSHKFEGRKRWYVCKWDDNEEMEWENCSLNMRYLMIEIGRWKFLRVEIINEVWYEYWFKNSKNAWFETSWFWLELWV